MTIEFVRNGEPLGSFAEEFVQSFVESGAIEQTDYFWQEGMAEWQLVSTRWPLLEAAPSIGSAVLAETKVRQFLPNTEATEVPARTPPQQARSVAELKTQIDKRLARSERKPPLQTSNTNKDHIPYCYSCGVYVSPNVISEQRGGVGVVLDGGSLSPVAYRSSSTAIKVCPHCGNRVRSKQDIEFDKQCDNDLAIFWLIMLGVGVLLFVVLPFSIVALVDG